MLVKRKVIVTLALVGLLQACTPIEDYMFGKDNTLKPQPLSPISPQFKLVEQWSVANGKSGNQSVDLRLQAVIRDHIIYTATAEGTVQATDKASGKVLWMKPLKQHLISGPSIGEGHIALATSSSSLIVLKQSNGEQVWQASLSGDALAKPVISHQDVLVKTIDGNLYNFSLKSGEKKWVVDHGASHLILKASSSPVVMDKVILAGFPDGKLDAVDRETGRVIWQRNIGYASGSSEVERLIDIDADPIVHGELVYLASYQGYLGALSLKTGEFIWRKPASIYQNIIIQGKYLYVVDSDSVVWSYDRMTGQVRWKQLALQARGLTEPVLMDNYLLVGDRTGMLHGLDISTGALISRTAVKGGIVVAPVVSGRNVFVVTTNGKLSRYRVI